MCGQIAYDWKTMPRLRRWGGTKTRGDAAATTRPRSMISPPSGCSRPAMRRRVVVFPQPLGPSSVNTSPRAISREAPSTAGLAPKSFLTPSRRRTVTGRGSALPQLSRRQACSLHERLELGPRDAWVSDPRAQAAVRARDHVLGAHQPGVLDQALGDQLGMLDKVAGVANDPGDEDLAVGELDVFPHPPFVVVPGIGRLDRIALGADSQDEVDQIAERQVVGVGGVIG